MDTRGLALFRILLGLVVLWDCLDRSRSLRVHYTSEGVLPWEDFFSADGLTVWSIHPLSGSAAFQGTLLALTALAALAFTVGARTRLANVVMFGLLLSMFHFAQLIQHTSDRLLLICLFFSLFTHLDDRWSLAALRRAAPARTARFDAGTAGMVLQIAALYHAAASHKSNPAWTWSGNALGHAFTVDQYATPLSLWAAEQTWFTRPGTVFVYWLQRLTPVALLLPVATPHLRGLCCLGLAVVHLGIAVSFRLGEFGLVTTALVLAPLPAWYWDRAEGWILGLLGRPAPTDPERPGPPVAPPGPRWLIAFDAGLRHAWTAVGAAFAAAVVAMNVGGGAWLPGDGARQVAAVLQPLGLRQSWQMFRQPGPQRRDWTVIAARRTDGREVDLLRDEHPLSWAPPPRGVDPFPTDRWRNYWDRPRGEYSRGIVDAGHIARSLERYAAFLCREGTRDGTPLAQVTFAWMRASGAGGDGTLRKDLLDWSCAKGRPIDPAAPAQAHPLPTSLEHEGATWTVVRWLGRFDGTDLDGWAVTGDAVVEHPAPGTWPKQYAVVGHEGVGLINTFHPIHADRRTGTLTSPPFVPEADQALTFLVGGGDSAATRVEVRTPDEVLGTYTGRRDETLRRVWVPLGAHAGTPITVVIVDEARGAWGHVLADGFAVVAPR